MNEHYYIIVIAAAACGIAFSFARMTPMVCLCLGLILGMTAVRFIIESVAA